MPTRIHLSTPALALFFLLLVSGCDAVPNDVVVGTLRATTAHASGPRAAVVADVLTAHQVVAFRYEELGIVGLFLIGAGLAVAYAVGGRLLRRGPREA